MSFSHCQCWIFDLDGTLTVAMHDFDALRVELDLPPGEAILEALNRLPAKRAAEVLRRLNEIEWQLAGSAQPQPGAYDLLTHLTEQGRQLGILTRNGTAIARQTLQVCGLGDFFSDDVIIGRESCAPKPNPAGIAYLLNRWQGDTSSTVMVGDHLFDMQAGQAAGVRTVYLNASGEGELPASTDLDVSTLAQLIEQS